MGLACCGCLPWTHLIDMPGPCPPRESYEYHRTSAGHVKTFHRHEICKRRSVTLQNVVLMSSPRASSGHLALLRFYSHGPPPPSSYVCHKIAHPEERPRLCAAARRSIRTVCAVGLQPCLRRPYRRRSNRSSRRPEPYLSTSCCVQSQQTCVQQSAISSHSRIVKHSHRYPPRHTSQIRILLRLPRSTLQRIIPRSITTLANLLATRRQPLIL